MSGTKKYKTALIFACFAMFLPTCGAQAKEESLNLEWKGKIISPQCFVDLSPMEGEDPDHVNLNECAMMNTENIDVDGNWVSIAHDEDYGYDMYEPLGKHGNDYLVRYVWNGGGSGHFSSVFLVYFDADQLKVKKHIHAGDRCNGGLVDAKLDQRGEIEITRWATPSDFAYIAYKNDKGLAAYKDLEAGAGSCFARVSSIGDDVTKIVLDNDAGENQEGWTENYMYQSCFNKEFSSQRSIKPELTLSEFRSYMDKFFSTCVDNAK